MSFKKFFPFTLAALCVLFLLTTAAFAHGCHGSARQSRIPVCTVEGCELTGRHYHGNTLYCGNANGVCSGTCVSLCTVEGCELTGRHYHGDTLYCGNAHANGVCSGACVSLCTVEGCELTGRHYHDGVIYCGANHSAGYCNGTCPFTQAVPASYGGHHYGAHH